MKQSSSIWNKVKRIQIRTDRAVTDVFAGSYHSVFKGRGMQFEDVREYQPGDEVRTIDWNVTARMHTPYVKNYREERELTVMVVVDLSHSSLFGSKEHKKREVMAEIGAVLALSALRNSDKVGLLSFTDRVECFLPPKKGMGHAMRLIRELLAANPKGRRTDMAHALNRLAKVQPRRGICFLISDFLVSSCDSEIALAAQRYDLNAICLTDAAEIDLPRVGLLTVTDLETDQLLLVDTAQPKVREQLRQRTLSRIEETGRVMRRVGASFVNVRTDEDPILALRSLFAQKTPKG